MESAHQDLEEIRPMTIFDQEWTETQSRWELGKLVWIKTQNKPQTQHYSAVTEIRY